MRRQWQRMDTLELVGSWGALWSRCIGTTDRITGSAGVSPARSGDELAGETPALPGSWRGRRRAFTLVELLSVIAIIGLLAGLILGVFPAVSQRAKRGGVKTQLAALQTAIDRYHSQKGYYPPDNPNAADLPPLFYELTGTFYNEAALQYQTTFHGSQTIPAAQVSSFFSIKGFLNSGATREEAVNFYESLRPSQFKETGANNLRVLVVPFKGTNAVNTDFNTWHYVSSNPTHNPDSYDLWAEIVIKGRTNVIGNWKE